MNANEGTIYLLHFDSPFGHARHYTGWAKDLEARIAEHRAGRGSNLIKHVLAAGIDFVLATTLTGDRNRERQLKNRGGAAKWCPVCKAEDEMDQPADAHEMRPYIFGEE